jgi:mRNA interferase RelE/StbE
MRVVIAPEAEGDVEDLPITVRARLDGAISRLEKWPEVSGAKPLRGEWKGHYRLRIGDWRVIFRVVRPNLIVVRVANRKSVYEE